MNYLALDIETTSLSFSTGDILLVGYQFNNWEASIDKIPDVARFVNCANISETLIGHNVKFDLEFLHYKNIFKPKSSVKIFDTLVAHWLLYPNAKKHGLKHLGKELFGEDNPDLKNLIGKYKPKGKKISECNITVIPEEILHKYLKKDIDLTTRLYDMLKPQIDEKNLTELFELEMDVIKVIMQMELSGIGLNVEGLSKYGEELFALSQDTYNKLVGALPDIKNINIQSSQQVSHFLFEYLKLPTELTYKGKPFKVEYKKKGKHYAVGNDTISKLKDIKPELEYLQKFNDLKKLRNTYVDKLPKKAVNGRIYSNFNIEGTATGRFSSGRRKQDGLSDDSPNLQNIPDSKTLRSAFISAPECSLVSCDYSQAELWVMAYLADDWRMKQHLSSGRDIYLEIAKVMLGLTVDDAMSKDELKEKFKAERDIAKTIVLGLNYGRTKWGLARSIGLSAENEDDLKTTQDYIYRYFRLYPRVSQFLNYAPIEAEKKGYIVTLCGRKRDFKTLKEDGTELMNKFAKARIAINTPIQGSVADFMKMAMIKLYNEFVKYQSGAKIISQIHDELLIECPDNELAHITTLIKKCMEKIPRDYGIPIPAEISVGKNWGEL